MPKCSNCGQETNLGYHKNASHVKIKPNTDYSKNILNPFKKPRNIRQGLLNEFNYIKKHQKKPATEVITNSDVASSPVTPAEDTSSNSTSTNAYNVNPVSCSYTKYIKNLSRHQRNASDY